MKKRIINSVLALGSFSVCIGYALVGCGGTMIVGTAATISETTVATEETTASDRIETITMEEIMSANKNETLVSRYSSFQSTLVDETGTLTNYADEEIYYSGWLDDDYGELYVGGELVYSYDNGVYIAGLYADVAPIMFYTDNILYSDNSAFEIIKSCEEKDGYLYITTVLPAENCELAMAERGYAYTEGEYLRIEYVLDADTLAQQLSREYEVKPDGTECLLVTGTVEYGLERPEIAQSMYEHVFAEDNLITVTVIADPDTDDEKEYIKQIPAGDKITVQSLGEDQTYYADRACTEEFVSVDGDRTIYIITKDRK